MMDTFQDIRQQERNAVQELHGQINAVDAEIQILDRARALTHAPGWAQYLQSVQTLCDRATSDLVTTMRGNEYLRWQQGRVQALRDVLTILRGSDQLSADLQQRKVALQSNLQELLKRAPRQQGAADVQGQ